MESVIEKPTNVKIGTFVVVGVDVRDRYHDITLKQAIDVIKKFTANFSIERFKDGSVGIFTDTDIEGLWSA